MRSDIDQPTTKREYRSIMTALQCGRPHRDGQTLPQIGVVPFRRGKIDIQLGQILLGRDCCLTSLRSRSNNRRTQGGNMAFSAGLLDLVIQRDQYIPRGYLAAAIVGALRGVGTFLATKLRYLVIGRLIVRGVDPVSARWLNLNVDSYYK